MNAGHKHGYILRHPVFIYIQSHQLENIPEEQCKRLLLHDKKKV